MSPLEGVPRLEELPLLEGQRVLVRVDFNVPLTGGTPEEVADDFRIRAALPTLRWLVERGAEVTCCSHLGRPKGRFDERFVMDPVARRLAELAPGVTLMENLRFDPGEKTNDPRFARRLVGGMDCYVNEAFGASHRPHASVMGPPASLPSAAGCRLAEEVEVLSGVREHPARPFVAIVGGAKVSDKLGLLRSLAERADTLAIGGAMAFTFLVAQGHEVGDSLVDVNKVEECRQLLHDHPHVVLPTDLVALEPGAPPLGQVGTHAGVKVTGTDLPVGWQGLDVGPETSAAVADLVSGAATVLWNGPLGAFEDPRFAEGTTTVAEAMAACAGFTVVGGGDSASAVDRLGLAQAMGFISTGGGACLALLEHGDLPALEALRHAPNAPSAR